MKTCLPFKPKPFLTLVMLVFIMASCSDTSKLQYLGDIGDGTSKATNYTHETVIRPSDLLSITVSSLNAEASALFNAPNEATPTTNYMAAGNTLTVGYLVNSKGDIQYPILGSIHVDGMTKSDLSKYLVSQMVERKLLVDPIVTIRYLNFRVSVLGEVNRPGVYTVPNEKVSMLEALGLAGDMTMYGRKDNVLLIRDEGNGEKTTRRIDMNSDKLLTSPYFYLHSNDVLFVEPSKNKVQREKNLMVFPVIISLATFFIIVMDHIKF